MCKKGGLIGLRCCSERTYGRIVALVHWGEQTTPNEDDIKETLISIKKVMKMNDLAGGYPL